MENEVLVQMGEQAYTTHITYKDLNLIADEPEDLGGQNLGFPPTALFLSSIGSCKAMTMRMYADRKQWKLNSIEIQVYSETIKSELQQTTFITCNIKIDGELDAEQRKRLYTIGEKCPIQKMLSNPVVIESNLIDTI